MPTNPKSFHTGGVDKTAKHLGPQTFTGEKYEGWRNWDTWEFNLLIDNDKRAYDHKNSLRDNFKRRIAKGTFDKEKAKYAIRQYLGPEVRRLEKEYGGDQTVDFNNVDFDETLNNVLED